MCTGPKNGPNITSPTIAQWLANAVVSLEPVTETPRLDAEILLAHVLGISRASLLARLRESFDAPMVEVLLERRKKSEPLAYILGEWEFFGIPFKVIAPLLTPRPETEHLVETVLEFVQKRSCRILEIGIGTGCISIAIAKNAPAAQFLATDINPVAIQTAQENTIRHGVQERIEFRMGSIWMPLTQEDAPFDVICSNPPYVAENDWDNLDPVIREYEDRRAIIAGPDGLDVIRPIIAHAQYYLKPGGLLALEIGDGQANKVRALLEKSAYERIWFVKDLAGIERIACATTHI